MAAIFTMMSNKDDFINHFISLLVLNLPTTCQTLFNYMYSQKVSSDCKVNLVKCIHCSNIS